MSSRLLLLYTQTDYKIFFCLTTRAASCVLNAIINSSPRAIKTTHGKIKAMREGSAAPVVEP